MTSIRFILRSLAFHARTHAGVILGCAVSTAILVGALAVGDSVRSSLRRLAFERLGQVDYALDTGRRYFGDTLADGVRATCDANVAAALHVEGMALHSTQGERRQVNRVTVYGVDSRFFSFALASVETTTSPAAGDVFLSERLAARLGATVGGEVSLRLRVPDRLSKDAPLAVAKEAETVRRNLSVRAILTPRQLGAFSLRSDQRVPMNAFVDRAWLQKQLRLDEDLGGTGGRANLLIARASGAAGGVARVQQAVASSLALGHLGVRLRRETARGERGTVQVETPRIYLEPVVADHALAADASAVGALTYLATSITAGPKAEAAGARTTPYSFVTALTPSSPVDGETLGVVPTDMKNDEIVINSWLAETLAVGVGESVTIQYAALAAGDAFDDRVRTFRVHRVVPIASLTAEREAVPQFPGLTDVDSCADWDIGVTTDKKKLEDPANEAYWKAHRETPKAFVTLRAGQAMWGNRYGDVMAVRYPSGSSGASVLEERLRTVDPASLGMRVRDVRAEAERTVNESMDLGQLFLGMSFFLIIASLLLTSMLFVFTVEQRASEMGVLRAVGYTPRSVRRLFLGEGTTLAIVGAVVGTPLGLVFAFGLIQGLRHAWAGAIAAAPVSFTWSATSVAIGVGAGIVISVLAMLMSVRRQAKASVRELLAADVGGVATYRPKRGGLRRTVFFGALVGAIGLAVWTWTSRPANPAPAFFGAGALALVAGIAMISMVLAQLAKRSGEQLTLRTLGVRNAARRAGRSLVTAAILASGTFMVLSVLAFREDLSQQEGVRASGTGGFELFAETSIAVHEDLNTTAGREAFGLRRRDAMVGVHVVAAKMRDGDDASCLNLNQSLTPPLVGVDPKVLSSLEAFVAPADADAFWSLLDRDYGEGVVPAILGDSATAMWKLKLGVDPESGAELDYVDERGATFRVKLVAQLPMRLSVLQGRLLIARRHFAERFPSEAGDRLFLIDTPAGHAADVAGVLTKRLAKVGIDVEPAVDRLRQFYTVESTYLAMFVVLGGLGLLLGTLGVGVLVLRNILERRGELAMLRAVGYSRRQIKRVIVGEHRFIVIGGLATGTIAAAIAVLPTVLRRDVDIPWLLLAILLVATGIFASLWIRMAARAALKAPLVPALRRE